MKEEFSELVEYLDGKFNKIDERFEKIDERFEKVDERFESLHDIFVTKDEFKAAVEVLSTKEDFNNLMNAVDAYAAKADRYFQEFLMLAQKVDRHEKWLLQIAEKLGIKLEY